MRKFFLLILFFLVQILAVYAEGSGKVSGEVVNFTSQKPVPSQEVTLKAWKEDSPVFEKKTITDESGHFEFSEVELNKAYVYEVSTNYDDVDYYSKQFVLTEDKSEITITVKVYEVSKDISNISIPIYHVVINKNEDSFEVFESFSLMNTGKTSFPNLLLELPKESKNLEIMQGFMECCAEISGNRLLHTMALKPGGEVFSLKYRLSLSESLDLSRIFPFDLKRLLVITELDTVSPSSSEFSPREVRESEEKTLYTFSMDEVKHGKRTELIFKTGIKPPNNLLWGIASLLFVAAFGGFIAFSLRRRSHSSMEERLSRFAQREKVHLSLISKLDEMRKSKAISEDVYEEFRREQEAKLRKVQGWLSKKQGVQKKKEQ